MGKPKKWDYAVMIRISREAAAALDEAAKALGIPRNDLIRILIANYVALIKEKGLHPAVALQRVLSVRGESGEQGTVG